MSETRPPTGQEPDEDENLDDLEELGDDAIIAQQTAAHAPQRRAVVSEESRSVVISDHPHATRDTEPPRSSAPRASAEPTLIIRDRRKLEEMRQQILARQRKSEKGRRSRAIYVWGGLGLAAFVLGGIVAFLATDSHDTPASAASGATPGRAEGQTATPHAVGASNPLTSDTPQPVKLDDLPVERAKKK
ncbi:MAG TPA: hypothetical protein VGM44_22855 [Polyangiaceae bacterium]